MSIHVALEHRSVYRFDRAVHVSPHVVRLRPAPHCRTPVRSYSMRVTPEVHFVNWQQDPFGNFLARLVFPDPTTELSVTVELIADLTVINPFDFFLEPEAEQYPFRYEPRLAHDLSPYLAVDEAGSTLSEWMAEIKTSDGNRAIVDFLVDVNRRVLDSVAYTTRMEPGVQSPDQTLELALGSCRDSAWLLVQVLRRLGLAARFASGYLVQLATDEPPLDGPAGPSEDFTDLHAWCEVYLPGAGWIGLDPTSGLLCGEGHIPLACAPDPTGASPITGAIEPCEVTLEHVNVVHRVHEDPRVTKPYTEAQWHRIVEVGRAIDHRLVAGDVRLTQGGEPTFVSMDDTDADEWTTAADGDDKRNKAWTLAGALADRFAPGGFIHVGQGKWYPGEPLPRWQIGVHWRPDGQPVWHRRDLLADPWAEGDAVPDDAALLVGRIAARLGIPDELVLPAYEDRFAEAWAEARRPQGDPPALDLHPTDPALANPDGRAARVAAVDRGNRGDRGDGGPATQLDPAGWVVPLHHDDSGWTTCRWQFRRGRLVLAPGDSPIGWRLPLDSISWEPPSPRPERSPFAPRPELAAARAWSGAEAPAEVVPATIRPVDDAPPTALCVQRRHGRLHVFLPPLEDLDAALALIATVEAVAIELDRPVVVEGYPPPRDPRTRELVVTPDPGVIEVNVHPAATWDELCATTGALYDEARRCRLATERFELDGTHSGTGGGNHVTLGGPTPADSPLLRRPDLLRSMVTYWQHHPSLSYLFSGRFVGPTSQAPRVDEARHDSLDELEIAFAELEHRSDDPLPWLVDRLFRHLLTDLTGNTHRAEFCIDKLYSPDSERGRLGLLELRAFEMPPHPRMALMQALLIRAIVSRLWDDPITSPLVRWGTELHDRFLLHHEVATDLLTVVEDLRDHGLDIDPSWFAPFLDFRFPRLGSAQVGGVTIELRAAIEPWMVLGEETRAGSTARYVDSSVERLQVRVDGISASRHSVTCNGQVIPLRRTSVPGSYISGVRYRAWKPPSALHPTIGVHAPLTFDLIDLWNGRSLGGCTYHVTHPGGRSYDRFPVNANEAEARRTNRFTAYGHTPGPIDIAAMNSELGAIDRYPRTLDLRRAPTGTR